MDDRVHRDAPGDGAHAAAAGKALPHPPHATSRSRGRRRAPLEREVRLAPPPPAPPPDPPGAQLRRLRRVIAGGIVLIVTAVALGDAVRGRLADGDRSEVPTLVAPSAETGPPSAVLLARRDQVPLYLPVRATDVTAVLYHDVEESAGLALEPLGRELDAGLLDELEQRIVGPESGGVAHYVDGGTTSVDIGATADTAVWSPVDGTITSIVPNVIDGTRYGDVISIQPPDTSLVVIVGHVRAASGLRVGDRVFAKGGPRTQLGEVADLSPVLDQDLRRFTQDAGNHVHLEVRQNLPLALP